MKIASNNTVIAITCNMVPLLPLPSQPKIIVNIQVMTKEMARAVDHLDVSWVGCSECVSVRVNDRVVGGAGVVSGVGGIGRVPRARVEGAVSALGDVVHAEHVRVEEVARHVGAVGGRVARVVGGLGLARGGALRGVEGAAVIQLHAQICVIASRGVVWGVDGAGEESAGAGEVGQDGWTWGWGPDVAWIWN